MSSVRIIRMFGLWAPWVGRRPEESRRRQQASGIFIFGTDIRTNES
tara:strand:+ start:235 stop:372 length:138 start_codon:yes stop_codon:yes gene_type:complete